MFPTWGSESCPRYSKRHLQGALFVVLVFGRVMSIYKFSKILSMRKLGCRAR